MSSLLKNQYFIAAVLLLPSAGFAADVQINGTCDAGVCPPGAGPTDSVAFGQSIVGSGSQNLIIGTDTYTITWSYLASYGTNTAGTYLLVDPKATYTGAAPSTTSDVITFNFFQNYYDTAPGTWDGTYSEFVPLSISGAAAGSTVEGELFIDGNGLGLVGPFGPGSNSGSNSANLTGFGGDTASTLLYEYEFAYDFQAGSAPGANAQSPIPEPAETLPLGLALAAAAYYGVVVRRRVS